MTTIPGPRIALYFDPDAYTEAHGRSGVTVGPAGLMGRQVAGKEFLDAYLTFGQWDTLSAVVRSRARADSLVRICHDHPSSQQKKRRLTIHEEADLFSPTQSPFSDGSVLHYPCPPDSRFAWARRTTGARFAISGVTHTLSSKAAVESLCDLLTAPYESCDALICTSKAVADMVRTVTGTFADYLADRFGGRPRLQSRLEVIPLGVNPGRFRPPTSPERNAERQRRGIADDEIAVLCVGRLSHHAKAHPFPVFHAAQQAAKRTGSKICLVFAGWSAHPAVAEAYRNGAAQFAPNVRVRFLDGLDPAIRSGIWHAADIFVSLPDNIQETFGLVVIEAMASGLPVIGSDWDGYRDLIVDRETGFLVPTYMVRGATSETTTRLLFGSLKYDEFLAQCSQATAVDAHASAERLTRLVRDAGLRQQFGAAGRQRVLAAFTWERVIRSYEALWADQLREVRDRNWREPSNRGPDIYPAPESSFAGYPNTWIVDGDMLVSIPDGDAQLPALLNSPLMNVAPNTCCRDRAILQEVLDKCRTARYLQDIAAELEARGVTAVAAKATIAWLLKYGMLRPHESTDIA